MVSSGSCSLSVPVNCSDTYNVNVSLNNIIGSSGPSPIANISKCVITSITSLLLTHVDTDILQPSMVDMISNESVRITYTPFIACDDSLTSGTIDITLNNINTSSMVTRPPLNYDTNGAVTIRSLNASTMYSYSLSLTVNGNDVCDGTEIMNFMTSDTGDDDGGTTLTPNVTTTTPAPTDDTTSKTN